jgi:hypothetical protein
MHKPAVAVAEDTVVAEATWAAALAEAIWAALAEVTSVASAEAASEVLAAVTWPACAESTLAAGDAISLAAVFTITALVARITRRTPGRTPATTECEPVRKLQTRSFRYPARLAFELANETSAHPGKLVNLDAALRDIKVDSTNFSSPRLNSNLRS